MPIRLIAVHFINVVPFMDKILALVKPFINKDMFQKVFLLYGTLVGGNNLLIDHFCS